MIASSSENDTDLVDIVCRCRLKRCFRRSTVMATAFWTLTNSSPSIQRLMQCKFTVYNVVMRRGNRAENTVFQERVHVFRFQFNKSFFRCVSM